MKNRKFESRAYGIRENKEIKMEGRIQFDLLDVIRREYKLRSYTLNSVCAHFLQQQKEDVHHCLPQADHQLLTDRGFLDFQQVRAELSRPGGTVRVACPVRGQHAAYSLQYHSIGLQQLVQGSSTDFVHLRSEDREEADKPGQPSRRIDLRVTDSHRMLARLGDAATMAQRDWAHPLLEAAELAASELEAVQLLCHASEGVSDPEPLLPLPFAAPLGLRRQQEQDAFVQLYGCWMQRGWLHSASRSVCLRSSRQADVLYLDALFARLPLPLLPHGIHCDEASQGFSRRLCDDSCTDIAARPAAAATRSEAELSERKAAHQPVLYCIRHEGWWRYFSEECGVKQQASVQRSVSLAVAIPAASAVGGEMETGCPSSSSHSPPRVCAAEASDGDSGRSFCQWVWQRLDARRLRLLLSGLSFTAGEEAVELVATSERSRDDYLDIALRAGFSATFDRAQLERGQSGAAQLWRVSCTLLQAQPTLFINPRDAQQGKEVQRVTGCGPTAVWCVSVPTPERLIVVRRVQREPGSGALLSASRPVLVGNSIISDLQNGNAETRRRLASYCFSEDTRLLTDDGFLFLDEVLARVHLASDGVTVLSSSLRVACFNAVEQRIEYHAPSQFILKPLGHHRMVEFATEKEQCSFSAQADEYGRYPGKTGSKKRSDRVSLLVTADHDMYVQLGKQRTGKTGKRTGVKWACEPGKGTGTNWVCGQVKAAGRVKAQELLSSDECLRVRLQALAPAGVHFARPATPADEAGDDQQMVEGEAEEKEEEEEEVGEREEEREDVEADFDDDDADDLEEREELAGLDAQELHRRWQAARAELPFVDALGLQTMEQLLLFLELYGFWLGDGSMQFNGAPSWGGAVSFAQRKPSDIAWLQRVIPQLGVQDLRVHPGDSQTLVSIHDADWFQLFDTEYGRQYKGSRHSSRHSQAAAVSPPSFTRSLRSASVSVSLAARESVSASAKDDCGGDGSDDANAGQGGAVCECCHSADSDDVTDPMLSCDGDGTADGGRLCLRGRHVRCMSGRQLKEDEKWSCEWCGPEQQFSCAVQPSRAGSPLFFANREDAALMLPEQLVPVGRQESQPAVEETAMEDSEAQSGDDNSNFIPLSSSSSESSQPTESSTPTDEDEEEEEEDWTKSVKWFWWWVLKRLDRTQIRRVLRGYRRADGGWKHVVPSEREDDRVRPGDGAPKALFTSGALFRDSLIIACLHAGFTASAHFIRPAGVITGYLRARQGQEPRDYQVYSPKVVQALSKQQQKQYKEIKSSAAQWSVDYARPARGRLGGSVAGPCTPILHSHKDIRRVEGYVGRVWCVTVPTGLIIAQRAKKDAQGGVAYTSRPVVVGNCLKDALLPLQLMHKLMLLINAVEMARVTGVPIVYLLTRGQQIKVVSQLYRKARQHGLVIPVRDSSKGTEETYEGATVIEPKKAYYTVPIATLDFASLYPSIMMSHNLCYSTLVAPADIPRLQPADFIRTPTGDCFVVHGKKQGVLPEILVELLEARSRAKREMKLATDPFVAAVLNGRQLALKISANCFPADDHELLTELGFFSLDDVKAHFAHHPTLSIACFVDGALQYLPIAWTDVTIATGAHDIVTFHSDASAGLRQGSHAVSLRVTANHRMWLRLGATCTDRVRPFEDGQSQESAAPPFIDISAAEALQYGASDPSSSAVQFCASFPEGASPSNEELPFVSALGLASDDEIDAFLELYGYWLGDGWLDSSCQALAFSPSTVDDSVYLKALFERLHLRLLPQSECGPGAAGAYIAPEPNEPAERADYTEWGRRHMHRIYSPAWWRYFAEQYGHKFAGWTALEAVLAAAARRGGSAPALRRTALTPVSEAKVQASAATGRVGRPSAAFIAVRNKTVDGVAYRVCYGGGCARAGQWLPSKLDFSARTRSGTQTAVYEGKCRQCCEDSTSEEQPLPAEDVDSAKWYWLWVLKRLRKRHLRLVLAGLCRADGHMARGDRAGCAISTPSRRFAEETARVALHAGYSVAIKPRGEVSKSAGVNAKGVGIIAQHQAWVVNCSEFPREAQPKLSICTETSVERGVECTVWCVTVPTRQHLICARRLLDTEGLRVPSRPVIVGNSVYGFTGAQVGQLPCLPISASVTAFGRDMIMHSKAVVERHYRVQNGYEFDSEVVYGDTDSIMVRFGTPSVQEAMRLGAEAAALVSREFVSPIRLEFEKVYFPYLLMNKKRYAGLYWSRPDSWDKMDTKGIETVRRDSCALVSNVVTRCLDLILIERDVDAAIAFVQRTIAELLTNRLDLSLLVISKSLGKSAHSNDYVAKQAHVELAERMRRRDPRSAPAVGDRVAYVICKAAKGAPAYEKAEDPIYVLEHDIPIDTAYYLSNQLTQPLQRLFEPVLPPERLSSLFSGAHTRAIKLSTPSTGGIMRFAVKKRTCLGCKVPLTGSDGSSGSNLCSHCADNRGALYMRQIERVREHEELYCRAWSQCQSCQGSLHQEVLCTSRDCPIFYRRKKVQKDLNDAQEALERFAL